MPDTEVKLLLADDSQLICKTIRSVLSAEPRIEVVGETNTFTQTIEAAETLHPNVILHMPAGQPDFDYLPAKARLHGCCDRVMAMSLSTDEETRSLAALYGAGLLLEKANLVSDLIPALLSSLEILPTYCKTRAADKVKF